MSKINYKKLCEIMLWQSYKGEDFESTFLRQDIKAHQLPAAILIDVVYDNGLEGWAKTTRFETIDKLNNEIVSIFKIAIIDKINNDKKLQELFPPIHNFCIYATRTDRSGKIRSEALKIAEAAWWGEIAQAMLKEKTSKIFNIKPDKEKYLKISDKIKAIWNFSDIEIDAIRYFVCQTRNPERNPSLNKSLYLWSNKKRTGKTTVARSIAAVLNGETSIKGAGKFESTFNKELQLNDHDLPYAAQFNCVILDEAMPKDSRKSYGRVKSMLTSDTCSFNQKYGRITSIKVQRSYIFTSNDDITELIQDDSERRLIEIRMGQIPTQMSFTDIYTIWREFCQNCTTESDLQEWYNTFEDVQGIQRKDISYFQTEIVSNSELFFAINNKPDYSLTLKFFEDILIKGKSTRDERNVIQKALIELFGEPKYYKWSRVNVVDVINELRSTEEFINNQENHTVIQDNELPF